MPRPESRKPAHRRRPTPIVESLEGRLLLNATAVTKPVTVHAEVMEAKAESTKLTKQEHAATVKLAKQEHAAAVKLAKQEHTAAVQYAKEQATVTAKAVAASPFAKDKLVKVGNKSVSLYRFEAPATPGGSQNTTPVAGAYTPSQLQTAYGTNLLGLANQGQGITIGIVDEFDDSSITNDAKVYSTQYGLPIFNASGSPTFSVIKDNALATVTASPTSGGGDVSGETSLDVELAHAMAPQANIILVEVPATGTVANEFAELLHGIQVAATQGAQVVSLSYGYAESSIGAANVKSQESTYLAPGTAASKVAVTVSTGDGSSPLFPATTPDVIAVGGTSLYLNSAQGDYGYETAWGGLSNAGAGGGGLSSNFAQPTFQSANGVTNTANMRSIPDVSMVADPVTAVSVYDSYDGANWTAYGGTSVASPMFAGVVALAQQDRIAAGLSILSSVQIDTGLYQAYTNPTTYANIFNDVTLGKNSNVSKSGRTTVTGYTATTGYDLATGLGSPWAALMIPYLAGL